MAISRESGFLHGPSELQKQAFQEDGGSFVGCRGWAFITQRQFGHMPLERQAQVQRIQGEGLKNSGITEEL